jgi:frataxin-like iron-binding protein CyaY
MLDVELSNHFHISSCYVLRSMPSLGQYWLFNTVTGEHFEVNETAYWVLERLQGEGMTWNRLLKEFLNTFDIEEAAGEADLLELLTMLCTESVISETQKTNGG